MVNVGKYTIHGWYGYGIFTNIWVVLGDRCIGKWTSPIACLRLFQPRICTSRTSRIRVVFSKPRWPSKIVKAKTLGQKTLIDVCVQTHRIHGTVIFTYMKTININYINVGKYHSPMDPTGREHFLQKTWLQKESWESWGWMETPWKDEEPGKPQELPVAILMEEMTKKGCLT